MKIKNWAKFQHFRDRKPPWIKLYRDLLDDLNWHELDPIAAKSLIMLWLIASESHGELPPIKVLSFRLRMPEKSIKSIVSKLSPWLEQDDINMISDINSISTGYQDDPLERERETEREGETYKPETETDTQSIAPHSVAPPINVETWKSYKGAYLQRYGVDPVRNAAVNSQIKQFVDRLGIEAPLVADFYLHCNKAYYVQQSHSTAAMLKDAEGLRTQWATGRTVTNTEALQADKTQARGNVWGDLIAEERERNAIVS